MNNVTWIHCLNYKLNKFITYVKIRINNYKMKDFRNFTISICHLGRSIYVLKVVLYGANIRMVVSLSVKNTMLKSYYDTLKVLFSFIIRYLIISNQHNKYTIE